MVRFLKHLLRVIPGKVLVIWDGAPTHRGRLVKAFLQEQGERIELAQLPGYTPELNPEEGIWQYLKHVELANRCCQHLGELKYELCKAVARLRHRNQVLQGCLQQPGYTLT